MGYSSLKEVKLWENITTQKNSVRMDFVLIIILSGKGLEVQNWYLTQVSLVGVLSLKGTVENAW